LNLAPIRKPPRLRSGDIVGVVAPSGAVDEERLSAGVRVLESWGFGVVLGKSVLERHAYFAGTDGARFADLRGLMDDPTIRAVFCARGGYGSQRLMPHLDLSALRDDPKPIIGYSDATALLAAALNVGVVGVHGPMVATDLARGLSERTHGWLRSLLTDAGYLWEAEVPRTIRLGRARGRLMGGCLSVLASTLGTPWTFDPRGAILFLEDVHERPYRLDRLLTQLRQAGKLDGLAGIVFGTMAACPTVDGIEPFDVAHACCVDLGCPVGFGVPSGHGTPPGGDNLALPFGVEVELDTERSRLIALEAAVV
jgi:muramoyltetrapeptide carboxypeptidase